jgi:hypothetical protein
MSASIGKIMTTLQSIFIFSQMFRNECLLFHTKYCTPLWFLKKKYAQTSIKCQMRLYNYFFLKMLLSVPNACVGKCGSAYQVRKVAITLAPLFPLALNEKIRFAFMPKKILQGRPW